LNFIRKNFIFNFFLFSSTNDGYATDALEEPSLGDIITEHLRVHADMRDTPHFG
jgi:hypothetical protein